LIPSSNSNCGREKLAKYIQKAGSVQSDELRVDDPGQLLSAIT